MSKVSRKQPEPGTAAFAAYTGYLREIAQGDEVIICSGSPHFKCTKAKATNVREGQCFLNGFWFSTVYGGLLTKAPIKHYILQPSKELQDYLARRQNEDFLCNLHPKLLAAIPDTELDSVCKMLAVYTGLQCNRN
jgi:hypothetical protein